MVDVKQGGMALPFRWFGHGRIMLLRGVSLGVMAWSCNGHAQDRDEATAVPVAEAESEIIVSGIRNALQSALDEKRGAASLVEVIQAEDIGKLPDQNLAEVLENIPGIQITREAGVGTGVQIRGTNANRVEINGVATVGAGSGRGGISFEDVNASIISAVEVVKAPEAGTIEGSVGGTVNLRTIRPLALKDQLIALRVQGEYSELAQTVQPRLSAAFGDKWSTGIGEIGLVLSGSYAEQDALSFRPRVDRDGGLVPNRNATVLRGGVTQSPASRPAAQDFDFVGIQFLNQALEQFRYTTINFAGTLEWAPSDNLKFYFDTVQNDQERRSESSRVQGSRVNTVLNVSVPTTFETVDFGSLDGVPLGSIKVAETGVINVGTGGSRFDPNLRFSSDTGARLTKSEIYSFGGEWETGILTVRGELARSLSNSTNPNLSTTLNFLNPNAPIGTRNDNAVPFQYDLSDGKLSFGIATGAPFAPTTAQLLDPANMVLQAVNVGNNGNDNKEDAARLDFVVDTSDFASFLNSVAFGYRVNKTSSQFRNIGVNLSLTALADSPRGTLFSELLVPGPTFFNRADGRDLFFRDFLVIDPKRSFSDQAGTLAILQQAMRSSGSTRVLGDPVENASGFFDIDETSHALYAQANFELGPVRGNAGFRWLDTQITSTGNSVAQGAVTQTTSRGSYSVFLPRLNLAADITDQLLMRASFTKDINRPAFNLLNTSVVFSTSENAPVSIGNPGLAPETVTSYDVSFDWYFAPASVLSVALFHKRRSDLFVAQLEDAPLDINGFRDLTAPCEGGGLFNPIAFRNILSPPNTGGQGLCVPIQTTINDTRRTNQTGVEVSAQYDLSQFEDILGFASGFGVLANYTFQDFGGGAATNTSATRGTDIFNAINGIYNDRNFVPVTAVQGLLDFSRHSYNVTGYYEKYGISARLRYTWRSAFRTLDTAGGASLASTFGFPVVTAARGQLNGGLNYDVNEWLNIGVEGVNITKSKISQYCVNDDALLCFEGLPDRRVTFGASVRF